jgi:Yip1 domain
MTDAGHQAGPLTRPTIAALWARVRGLLLAPGAEWRIIEDERPTQRQLFLHWVGPLTVFFFLAPMLGSMAFPARVNGVVASPSAVMAIYTVIVGSGLMLGGVWAMAWIIDWLAPTFGGKRNFDQAMKLAAYSGTALWLSGVFGLVPAIVLLGAVGIVSFYTLYRGLPVLMKADADKVLAYAASIVAATAVLGVVLMTLSSCFALMGKPPPAAPKAAQVAPVVMAPAKGVVDPKAAIDMDKFRRLMPESIPGSWVRAGLIANNGGTQGFTGRTLEGVYERGGQRLTVRLIDLGAAGGAKMVADAQALRPPRQDAEGYLTYAMTGDGFTVSELDRKTGTARRLTIVRDRVVVAVEGSGGVSMDELTGAGGLVDMERVDQVARGL